MIASDKSGERRRIHIEGVLPLLEVLNPERFRFNRLLYGGAEERIASIPKPDLVYNGIGDPDRCSRALFRAEHASRNNPIPVINLPERVRETAGDRAAALLESVAGVIVPKCVRLTPSNLREVKASLDAQGIRPPFIFKEAGTDEERPNDLLVETASDLERLERFAFDGRAYYATEYFDYRSPDGLYRKYRCFVIGEAILPGHLIISDTWRVTDDATAHEELGGKLPALLQEEEAFLTPFDGERFALFAKVRERLALDYFSIDFALKDDGTPIFFNLSCKNHYFSKEKREHYYTKEQIQRYNQAVESMLLAKLKGGKR